MMKQKAPILSVVSAPRQWVTRNNLKLNMNRLAVLLFFATFANQWSIGQSVKLAWDASEDERVTSYQVRYGTSSSVHPSMVDVGKNTTATITGLSFSVDYYFVVYALTASGLTSLPSNEVYTIVEPPPSSRAYIGYHIRIQTSGEFELQQSVDMVNWITVKQASDYLDIVIPTPGVHRSFYRVTPWNGETLFEGRSFYINQTNMSVDDHKQAFVIQNSYGFDTKEL